MGGNISGDHQVKRQITGIGLLDIQNPKYGIQAFSGMNAGENIAVIRPQVTVCDLHQAGHWLAAGLDRLYSGRHKGSRKLKRILLDGNRGHSGGKTVANGEGKPL